MNWQYYYKELMIKIKDYQVFYSTLRVKKNGELYKLSIKNKARLEYLTQEIKRNFYHYNNKKNDLNLSVEEFELNYDVDKIIKTIKGE